VRIDGHRATLGRSVTISPSSYTLSDTKVYSDMLSDLDIDDFDNFVFDKYGERL